MQSYISEVDGSQQPFGLYLPEPFDPNVPHPVVFHLHAGGCGANSSFIVTDASREWIMVKPDERGQHPIHAGLQENDVFRVLDEVRSRYTNAVDDNTIYVTGWSMNDTLPRGLRKTTQIEAPVEHACQSKFLLVKGTGKEGATQNRLEAEQFAADWNLRDHANISPVDDTSVTRHDIATSNLILFGTADSN